MSNTIHHPQLPWFFRLFRLFPDRQQDPQPSSSLDEGLPQNLIGREGHVLLEIRPGYYRGKVAIGTKVYPACCRLDGKPLYEGEWVQVVGFKLGRLVVDRKQSVSS
ncbi:MAG: NfeD family protein [Bacteroidia bacterium]|nr:NfeD family protein [Bacteroidia bacterium]